MPKIKDFEKDFETYKKQATLRAFIVKHYDFIKGKTTSGETLTTIFNVAQAMGFLKDFDVKDFQSAYHRHKERIEKKEKSTDTSANETADTENSADISATVDTTAENPVGTSATADTEKPVEELIKNQIIVAADTYARAQLGDDIANEFVELVKGCKPTNEKTLRKHWFPHLQEMLAKGVIGTDETGEVNIKDEVLGLLYAALVAFFKKETPDSYALAELPAQIQKLIEKRCSPAATTAPAAQSGGEFNLLNQHKE